MSTGFPLTDPSSSPPGALEDGAQRPAAARWRGIGEAKALWRSVPIARRRAGVAVLGALAAAGVGWLTAENPAASPAHVAVVMRVTIIAALIGTGVYAQASEIQTRMGGQLIAVGFLMSLWLLNGSSNATAFSVGSLFAVSGPPAFAYLMLAYPSGRLRSRAERQFIWGIAGVATTFWIIAVLTARQPPLTALFAQCAPHCPGGVFSLGSATYAPSVLRGTIVLAWIALSCGTPVFLSRRLRSASDPARRALAPIWLISVVNAVLLVAYLVSRAAGVAAWAEIPYVVVTAAVPIAFFIALSIERSVITRALTDVVSQLSQQPEADPQVLIARALNDESLRIAYHRPTVSTFVDSGGVALGELPAGQAITWVERDGRPVAAVTYDPNLAGQERLLQAVGAVALMWLEKAQLEAELKASAAELTASRVRMAESAHNERHRLERDLHDGVQQQLVGLRIKLELTADTIRADPEQGQLALASIGRQMDDALKALRRVAHGIYPELLHDRGLAEALRAAARGMPTPAVFRATGIERYAEDVELAVYYCCLEALQNTVKHAPCERPPAVTLWLDGSRLWFDVRDFGAGFDMSRPSSGAGLINMRDRIQTVGGTVDIRSHTGRGTSVRGQVPVALGAAPVF